MNSFPVIILEVGLAEAFYDVTKNNRNPEGPIYSVTPQDGFAPAFRLIKTENGWRQVPPKKQEFGQSVIDKAGVEIEEKEPDGFDEYDEEAELGMMGLDDEETSEGFDWVQDE